MFTIRAMLFLGSFYFTGRYAEKSYLCGCNQIIEPLMEQINPAFGFLSLCFQFVLKPGETSFTTILLVENQSNYAIWLSLG